MTDTLLPVVDAIREGVPVPGGTVRDDSGAAPIPYLPGHLYVWPRTDVRTVQSPEMDRSEFNLRLAITVEAFETAEVGRDRSVTEALDAWLVDVSAWVLAHRASPPGSQDLWGQLRISVIDHEAIRGPEYRGALVDLAGWRFIETAEV